MDLRDHREEIINIGRGRYETSKEKNCKSVKIDDEKGSLETNVDGVVGEYALSVLFGLDTPDSDGPDDGYDFLVNGYEIEVKTRGGALLDFPLLTDDPEDFDFDIGVLVWDLSNLDIVIVGWTDKDHFMRHWERMKLKDYRAAIKWKLMRPIWTLPHFLEGRMF